MEVKTLQNFLMVAREENLSRAASLLKISLPALSRQMAALEDELGVQLFTRSRHLQLTEQGMQMERRAREICSLMEKTREEFRKQTEVCGTISIGSSGVSSYEALSPIMAEFRNRYPHVQFELYYNGADPIRESLEHGLLDFGILLEPIDVSRFSYMRLKQKEIWGILTSTESDLARKETVSREDLVSENLLIPSQSTLKKEFENWFRVPLSELNLFGTFNVISSAAYLVENGTASALTVEYACALYDPERLVFRKLRPELAMHSVLAWKKVSRRSRQVELFLEYLKERADTESGDEDQQNRSGKDEK